MDLILRPDTWPRWQSEIETATGPDRVAPGDRVEGRARMLGFIVSGRSSVLSVTPDGLEQKAVVGVRMRIRYTVRPAPGGALVEHRGGSKTAERTGRQLALTVPAAPAAQDAAQDPRRPGA